MILIGFPEILLNLLKDIALKIDNLKLQNFIESILRGKQAPNKSKG